MWSKTPERWSRKLKCLCSARRWGRVGFQLTACHSKNLFPFNTQLSSQTCTPQKTCSAMGQCHVNSSHLNAFSITNQKLPLQDLRETPQLWGQSHAQWYPPCCVKFYAMKTCSYVMEILHGVQYQSMVCVCLFLLYIYIYVQESFWPLWKGLYQLSLRPLQCWVALYPGGHGVLA